MTGAIHWKGTFVPFTPGETVAQALARSGVRAFGASATGQTHSVFCGIGQCQNCLIQVAGRGAREACLLPCEDGLILQPLDGGCHA